MKLSVSAYRAQASAHQKILNNSYQILLNYGATCSTAQAQPLVRSIPTLKVEEVEASRGQAMVDSTGMAPAAPSSPPPATPADPPPPGPGHGHGTGGTTTDSGGSASESSPQQSGAHSLATSREEDGEEEAGSSKRDSLASSDKSPGQRAPHLDSENRSTSVGEQKWRNVRAVMALYTRLRKIKRTKSNQRWMKLRTTVQLSGAITSTIQKKAPLKREDSFLKRFSTRQIPETQETVDTGDDGDGGPSSQSAAIARRRRRRRQQRLPRTVVNPDENFYFYWLFVLTVCVLYNLWTLIVRQSFPELQRDAKVFWFSCDSFSDAIFLFDVAVQFRTGYLEQGLMVYDSKKLAGHYLRSNSFLLDLCALLPLDLLQLNFGPIPILRFPRFLKLYRVYDYYYMVESRTVYPNLWRVVNLIHILLILAHWFGCFYFLLSEAENFQGDWVYPYRPGDYATLTRKYLGSLYWSTLTLTTIGDLPTPETNADSRTSSSSTSDPNSTSGLHVLPRRALKSRLLQFSSNRGYVFTIVSYLIGVFIFATIVGQVGNVITNRNANRLEFERLLDGAKTYMRHHKVPGGMKRRVLRWYDYSWSRGRIQGGGDINTALGLLPDKLKTELALHVNLSVLKKVTIFQECQPEFLHDLVLKMKAYIFTPGDLICRKGEVAREMFIIADGILEVMSETGRVLTTMKAGDFFGEIGILNLDGLNKRTADVRSVGYSELFSLSREDVLAAMKDYPEAQEILQSLGRKRLMEARNMNRPKSGTGQTDGKGGGGDGKSGTSGADGDNRTGKRIVEKLRSDVKGLKNVLRKSRRGTRTKDESLELQPLAPGSVDTALESSNSLYSSGKGVLRRMSRVRSDETYCQEDSVPNDQQPLSPTEKLGAGLPLLHRLRLLKEKQDREEKGKTILSPTSSTPPTGSLSPPPSATKPPEPQEGEVIGAGLPLIQRLLLLKQKEDKEKLTLQAMAAVTADVLTSAVVKSHEPSTSKSKESNLSPPAGDESRHSSSKEHSEDETSLPKKSSSILNRLVSLKHKDTPGGSTGRKHSISPLSLTSPEAGSSEPPAVSKPPHLRDKLKTLVHKDLSGSSSGSASSSSPQQTPTGAGNIGVTSVTTAAPPPPMKKQQSWTLLKKAAIVSASVKPVESKMIPLEVSKTLISPCVASKLPPLLGIISGDQQQAKLQMNVCEPSSPLPLDQGQSPCQPEERRSSVCFESKKFDVPHSIPSKIPVSSSLRFSDVPDRSSSTSSGDVDSTVPSGVQCAIAQDDSRPSDDNNITQRTDLDSGSGTNADLPEVTDGQTSDATVSAIPQRKTKPSLLRLQQGSKFYMSIDDLSPEYSGLPFVKKLKILNERQKLAELERKVAGAFMRSSSLDSSNTTTSGVMSGSYDAGDLDSTSLTRSHSEASAMEYVRAQQLSRDSYSRTSLQTNRKDEDDRSRSGTTRVQLADLAEPPPHSPESNETLERRNLKSILKKLSASSLFSGSTEDSTETEEGSSADPTLSVDTPPVVRPSSIDMRKLMRAPTIEGYAARHSKLTKSVTFNRDTLQSPPATVPTPTQIENLFPIVSGEAPPEVEVVQRIDDPVLPSVETIDDAEEERSSPVVSSVQVTTSPETSVVSVTTITATVVEAKTTLSVQDTTTTTVTSSAVQSPVKKKPQVSFLVQHPQLPLSANQKNFFRPSLLLPSHGTNEEEYFGEVIVGIKQVIQSHLEEIQNKFQSQFQSLELEVKRRDDIITQLQERIHELEHRTVQEPVENGDDGDISEDLDETSDQPFMRGDSVDTVIASPPPTLPDEDLEDILANSVRHRCVPSPSHQQRMKRRSWEDHSEEETLELLDLPRSISPQHVWQQERRMSMATGNGVARHDTCTLQLGSSESDSSSGDGEDDGFVLEEVGEYNHNWEVQMLAREMERREGISQLEDEVRELKEAVSSSDLARLTSSELDILERMLMAEDRKVRAAARALSLDSDDDEHAIQMLKREARTRSPSVCSAVGKRKLVKQRSSNGGGSIESLIHKTSLLRNRLLSSGASPRTDAATKRQQFLNARSLSEHPDMPQTSRQPVRTGARSASSGNLTRTASTSPFAPFMRGLGQLVRHSSVRTSPVASAAQVSTPMSPRTVPDSVPTISQTCGADDAPAPPPDL